MSGHTTSVSAATRPETGRNTRYVLGLSMAGVIVAFIVIGTYMGLMLPFAH